MWKTSIDYFNWTLLFPAITFLNLQLCVEMKVPMIEKKSPLKHTHKHTYWMQYIEILSNVFSAIVQPYNHTFLRFCKRALPHCKRITLLRFPPLTFSLCVWPPGFPLPSGSGCAHSHLQALPGNDPQHQQGSGPWSALEKVRSLIQWKLQIYMSQRIFLTAKTPGKEQLVQVQVKIG